MLIAYCNCSFLISLSGAARRKSALCWTCSRAVRQVSASCATVDPYCQILQDIASDAVTDVATVYICSYFWYWKSKWDSSIVRCAAGSGHFSCARSHCWGQGLCYSVALPRLWRGEVKVLKMCDMVWFCMIWIDFLRTSLSKCLPMFAAASLSQKRASGIWTVQGQRAHAPASWHILAFAHGQTAGNSLNCTKKEPHSTCTWKKVWYAWWSPRDGLLLLVFAPPWSKVGTFLMEFALPDQPGEQDCWGGITGSEKGHCGKQRSPAAAWHWAQEIAERARAYGTLVQPVAAISWAFMGSHSAFGHNLCDSMIQI